MLLGCQHRVEQQLPILATRVALTDPGVTGQDVVAVPQALARERAVVQADQAHDSVRYGAHRYQRADGQRAGAEAGAGGPAGQRVLQRAADVGECRPHLAAPGGIRDRSELAGELGLLPRVLRGGSRQPQDGVEQALGPLPGGVRVGHQLLRGVQPVDELGEAAEQLDVRGVDVVHRQRVAELGRPALDRDTQQQPVDPLAPGALRDGTELPRRAVGRVQSPADAG